MYLRMSDERTDSTLKMKIMIKYGFRSASGQLLLLPYLFCPRLQLYRVAVKAGGRWEIFANHIKSKKVAVVDTGHSRN